MGTKFDNCQPCKAMEAIAACGLFYKCYRQEERERERATSDRHNPGIHREHKKLFKALSSVMGGLADMGCVRDDIFDIKKILQPYLEPIAQYLNLDAPEPAQDPEPPLDPLPDGKADYSEHVVERSSLFTGIGTGLKPGFQKKPSKKIHRMPERL